MNVKFLKNALIALFLCLANAIIFVIYLQDNQHHHNVKVTKPPPPTTPHFIHFVFLGGKGHLIRNFYKRHIRQCMKVNSNYTFILWTEENTKVLIEQKEITQHIYDNMDPKQRSMVSRSDVLRYLVLYFFGGIYMDLDTVCQKPIDLYIKNRSVCYWGIEPPLQTQIVYKMNYVEMNNFIFCPPRHPFLKEIMDDIHPKEGKAFAWKVSGPLLIHQHFNKYRLNKTHPIQLVDRLLFHPNVDRRPIKKSHCKKRDNEFKKRVCNELDKYMTWLDEEGEKNAVLLHDWSHLAWKPRNEKDVFDPFKEFPDLKQWPTTIVEGGDLLPSLGEYSL